MKKIFKLMGIGFAGYISYKLLKGCEENKNTSVEEERKKLQNRLDDEMPRIKQILKEKNAFDFEGLSPFWENAVFYLEDLNTISNENTKAGVICIRDDLARKLAEYMPEEMYNLRFASSFRAQIRDHFNKLRESRSKDVIGEVEMSDSKITDILMNSNSKAGKYMKILNSK